ncbi:type II toxin-antitoxin system PemK/MazF family toxin [Cellulomonas marina]|uniref:type II toxin-antitoxin system PemK/MazF family toxin n=1 Tax=Cellulomonas marina TaxID=988821 RepID=UPI003571257A
MTRRVLAGALRAVLRLTGDAARTRARTPAGTPAGTSAGTSTGTPAAARRRPPAGTATRYAPRADGRPDPGEVVWAWVPFEDDPARGKDRPVLLVGREGGALLGLPMTSKDHDRDAADEARHGRRWMDVGTGGWDARGRPSEVRLDRVLRLDPAAVRREGAALPRAVFDRVVAAL